MINQNFKNASAPLCAGPEDAAFDFRERPTTGCVPFELTLGTKAVAEQNDGVEVASMLSLLRQLAAAERENAEPFRLPETFAASLSNPGRIACK